MVHSVYRPINCVPDIKKCIITLMALLSNTMFETFETRGIGQTPSSFERCSDWDAMIIINKIAIT